MSSKFTADHRRRAGRGLRPPIDHGPGHGQPGEPAPPVRAGARGGGGRASRR